MTPRQVALAYVVTFLISVLWFDGFTAAVTFFILFLIAQIPFAIAFWIGRALFTNRWQYQDTSER